MNRLDWISEQPLEKMVAALSEGFCPRCGGRLVQQPPFELDEENDNPPAAVSFAQGGCLDCGQWMRAGHAGSDPDRDWFSVTMLNQGLVQGVLTLSLNLPSDDDDDDEWEPEDEEF